MSEKIFNVLDVIVKVAGIVSTVAQIIANTFKVQQQVSVPVSQEDAHLIKDFMSEELK